MENNARMGTPLFVWLGSNRARKRGVGLPGRLLDLAAKAGLPMPPGAILLDDFYRVCRANGLVEAVDSRLFVPDPGELREAIFYGARLPTFRRLLVIRPVNYPSTLDGINKIDRMNGAVWPAGSSGSVDSNDPGALAAALSVAWSTGDGRRDVALMETTAARWAGTAQTGVAETDDLVTLESDGAGESTLALARTNSLDQLIGDEPPFAHRLRLLLRGARRTFGRGEWGIEWADDGQVCRLLWAWPADLESPGAP
jgi:hypothetical protein